MGHTIVSSFEMFGEQENFKSGTLGSLKQNRNIDTDEEEGNGY